MSRRENLRQLRAVLRTDFERTLNDDDRRTIFVYRLGQAARNDRLLWVLWKLLDRTYMHLGIGAEIPPTAEIGPGLLLRHAGRGVVIHPGTVIGANATIFHRVTIGQRGGGRPPVIGDNAYFGVGASVLGPITVGDDVAIGAGAVLIDDAPDGSVMVGVPAAPKSRSAAV